MFNPFIRGYINYCSQFYKSACILRCIGSTSSSPGTNEQEETESLE
jgi:hypothetical protein